MNPWNNTEFRTRNHMRYRCRCRNSKCSTYRFTLTKAQLWHKKHGHSCRSCGGPITIDWYRMYKGSNENYENCRCGTHGHALEVLASRGSPHRKGTEGCLHHKDD